MFHHNGILEQMECLGTHILKIKAEILNIQ